MPKISAKNRKLVTNLLETRNKTMVVQCIREAKTVDDALKVINGLAANGWLRQWDNATHDDGTSWRDVSVPPKTARQDEQDI